MGEGCIVFCVGDINTASVIISIAAEKAGTHAGRSASGRASSTKDPGSAIGKRIRSSAASGMAE